MWLRATMAKWAASVSTHASKALSTQAGPFSKSTASSTMIMNRNVMAKWNGMGSTTTTSTATPGHVSRHGWTPKKMLLSTTASEASAAATQQVVLPKKKRSFGKVLFLAVIVSASGTAAYAVYHRNKLIEIERSDLPAYDKPRKRVVVLGTGWGALPVMKAIDSTKYEVVCVSPRNYFLMTPLLPSVAVGTVETRTVCESLRALLLGKKIQYIEAECVDIDPKNKIVTCGRNLRLHGDLDNRPPNLEPNVKSKVEIASSSRSISDSTRSRPNFDLSYDYLIVAIGAENQTFNTPGVSKHAHFLKEVPDARRIRAAISDAFESAVQPGQSEEERKRLLHFVIVGGGPTGVEFAAELNDLVNEDLSQFHYRLVRSDVNISLVEALPSVLTMYDKTISEYTMKHFTREHIEVLANTFVKEVKANAVVIQEKGKQPRELQCSLVVWATGIKPRPLVDKLRVKIGETIQNNRRALLTNQYMEVLGAPGVFAIGDCATIDTPHMLGSVKQLFEEGDVGHNSKLTLKEFQSFVDKKRNEYPQLEFYVDAIEKAFQEGDLDHDGYLSMAEFTSLLEKIDKKIKILPATAQVANQEGIYLGKYLNHIDAYSTDPSYDPHKAFRPFRYRHLGSLAYIGSDEAVIDLTGTKLFNIALGGRNAFYLWRSFYFTEMFTWRTKFLLLADYIRKSLFGRDLSRV